MTESQLYRKSDYRDMTGHFEMEREKLQSWQMHKEEPVFCTESQNPFALNLQNDWVREQYENFKLACHIVIPSDRERQIFEMKTTNYYMEHGAEGDVDFSPMKARRRIISNEELGMG